MNIVGIVGRLTADPELKGSSESPVATFSVAVDRAGDWDSTEKKPDTGFFRVSTFGKSAEFVTQYFKKGSPIGVEGSLKHHKWENESGKQSSVEIVASRLSFVGSKIESVESEDLPEASSKTSESTEEDPFS